MKRHFKIGLGVAVAVAMVLTAMAVFRPDRPPGVIGMTLLSPSLPMIWVVELGPLAPDDSEGSSSGNYALLTATILFSSVFWGFMAGVLSKFVLGRGKKAA